MLFIIKVFLYLFLLLIALMLLKKNGSKKVNIVIGKYMLNLKKIYVMQYLNLKKCKELIILEGE